MIGLGYPLIRRIIRLTKAERITSVADFIAARYGKNEVVARRRHPDRRRRHASLCLASAEGGLRLGASTLVGPDTAPTFFGDMSLLVALSMALFAVLFGTRHVDATEHQEGLMLAIATELVVKLVAFVAVGVFVTFVLFDGPADLFRAPPQIPGALDHFTDDFDGEHVAGDDRPQPSSPSCSCRASSM